VLLGEAAIAVGDDNTAELHYQRVLTEASQAGHLRNQAEAWNMLGQIARHRGDFGRASSLLGRALELFRACDNHGAAAVLGSLGEVARDAGQPAEARQLFAAALREDAVFGDKRNIAYDLEGFAATAALEHAGRQALVYLGAAQLLREETGGPLPPVEQRILDRILTPATAALPDRERQDALSEGRNQPLSAIIARALDELPAPGAAAVQPASLPGPGHTERAGDGPAG